MIDYKKLEMAHCLALKCQSPMLIQQNHSREDLYYRLIPEAEPENFFDFEDEDGLISKLNQFLLEQKLREMKSESSRWQPGTTVWLLDGYGKIMNFIIEKIHLKDGQEPWFYESNN